MPDDQVPRPRRFVRQDRALEEVRRLFDRYRRLAARPDVGAHRKPREGEGLLKPRQRG
jgi:hypothetical protein